MKPPAQTELQIQASILQWLNTAINCRVAAIPNGYLLSPAMAARRKREGLSKGAPDLVVAYSHDGEPRTLWIECKSSSGRLTQDQADWRDDLVVFGHDHIIARSVDDVGAFFK